MSKIKVIFWEIFLILTINILLLNKNSKILRLFIYLLIVLLFSISFGLGQIEKFLPTSHFHDREQTNMSMGNFITTDHLTTVDISDIDNITITEQITISNNQNSTESVYLWLNQTENQKYNDLIITDEVGNQLNYELVNDTDLLNITLQSELDVDKDTTLFLTYKMITQLGKVEVPRDTSYYVFVYNQFFSYTTNQYTLLIRLPERCFPHGESVPGDSTSVVSGKNVHIIWERNSISPSSSPESFIVYFDEEKSLNPIWGYVVGPLLGLALGCSFMYFWMRRGSSKLKEEIEKIYLTKNQQLLLKLIDENQGKITQQELIMITDFTKSKVSRNLTPLEENGLISKEKWGREYKVYLTKKGSKLSKKIVAEELQQSSKKTQSDFSKEEKTMEKWETNEDK